MVYRVLLFVLVTIGSAHAQNESLVGTYMTSNGMVTLQLKAMSDEFHGVIVSSEGIYALKSNLSDNTLKGTVFTNVGNYAFEGTPMQGGLSIVSEGVTYAFYQTSKTHELDAVDLTPYFNTSAQGNTSTQNTKTSPNTNDTKNNINT